MINTMLYAMNLPFEVSDTSMEYNELSFGSLLKNPFQKLSIDLSSSTLLESIDVLIQVKRNISPEYGKHYSCLKHHLKSIEKHFTCKIMPHHVTDVFWCNFIPYLIKQGLSLSTIKTVCSQLKTAVQWAGKHHARISDTYDMVKIPPYCHQQIALTLDEVSHIYHFDILSINRRCQYIKHIEKVKDMFVLSCNLGQRFSDMIRIDKSCFDRNIFSILQQKTGTSVRVDIERMSLDRNTTYEILEKYNYKSPLSTDISCYDRYLKQLLMYIGRGFNANIKRETKINGHVKVDYFPKWKLIGSHTARRTFITNNVIRGYNSMEIMRASGHKSYSSFEKYLCYFND
nr:MAG TPA: Integrase [Caudoviricetes sp.]